MSQREPRVRNSRLLITKKPGEISSRGSQPETADQQTSPAWHTCAAPLATDSVAAAAGNRIGFLGVPGQTVFRLAARVKRRPTHPAVGPGTRKFTTYFSLSACG
eukprot:1595435-Rhodomonas_salina.1